ncbi:nuclear transport factor 2 family protein [Rhizobium leguminosarum]|nr:nuclear transport factor 2 family protein [Rhizobium leguminosarum]
MRPVSFQNDGVTLAGTLHLPADYKAGEKRPGVLVTESAGPTAVAEADFQAVHRIGAESWVLMGHYRYDLTKIDGTWKVSRLVMIPAHETGNRALVDRATERAGQPG